MENNNGGGGGRVSIVCQQANNFAGSVTAFGGTASAGSPGGAGTDLSPEPHQTLIALGYLSTTTATRRRYTPQRSFFDDNEPRRAGD